MLVHFIGSIILMAVLSSAAITKIFSFATVTNDLRTFFRHYSRLIATLVISLEIGLATSILLAMWIQGIMQLALLSCVAFFVSATIFLAYRLVVHNNTHCGCWGMQQSRRRDIEDSLTNIIRPAWYGFRNGTLLLITWFLFANTQQSSVHSRVETFIGVAMLCPGIIAVGLASSVVVRKFWLTLTEHPLKREFAPRLAPLVALNWYRPGNTVTTSQWGAISKSSSTNRVYLQEEQPSDKFLLASNISERCNRSLVDNSPATKTPPLHQKGREPE
jgi:hypothetical protein